MAQNTLSVTIQGCGPYGFRLSGGNGEPMTIIKMRRQGKAHQAGLREGDTVLGINGFSSRTMDHMAAMGLLESAVQSIELLLFRGGSGELNAAYDEAGSRLRDLPAGAAPPPRVLPPPPSGESGSLVIDQPGFMRPASERFVVDERPPIQNGPASMWQPSPAPPQPFKPFEPVEKVDPPAPKDWSTGVWSNAPSNTPARWTPYQQPIAMEDDDTLGQNFQVATAPSTDPNKPWMWKPQVTFEVKTAPAAQMEPLEDWHALPTNAAAPQQDERDSQVQQQARTARAPTDEDINGLPKWALPLRSDYDWKKSYPWLVDEHAALADDDEWEYGYTDDGQLVKRQKKIFADSSFYDDPNEKYPTISEQIKMARKVALSLTAPTNVSARGQRMFLRRREKADRWVISEQPPPNMAKILRLGSSVGGDRVVRPVSRAGDDNDSERPYYNPTPWLRPVGGNDDRPRSSQEPVKTPTSGVRLPWKTDYTPSSSDFRPPSPPQLSGFGQPPKWTPAGQSYSSPDVSGLGNVVKDTAVPKFAAPGGSAFRVSKELRQMKGKGGKMFAQRRAQAAEDERREDLADTLKVRHILKVTGGDADWVDAETPTRGGAEANGWAQDQPAAAATPVRLLELIDRTRATSPSRYWTQTSTTVEKTTTKNPSDFGKFSAEVKSRGNFRPVRFKAPPGGGDYAPSTTLSHEDNLTTGISDF